MHTLRLLFTEHKLTRDVITACTQAGGSGATSALLAKVTSGILPYIDTEKLFGTVGLTDSELLDRYEEVFPEMRDAETIQKLDAAVDSMLATKDGLHAVQDEISNQVAQKFMNRIG